MKKTHPFQVAGVTAFGFSALWIGLATLSDWGAYWICWIVFGFLLPEIYGLIFNTNDTLSENVWRLEHLNFGHPFDFASWTPLHYAVALVVWGLFLWLSLHLPFGLVK